MYLNFNSLDLTDKSVKSSCLKMKSVNDLCSSRAVEDCVEVQSNKEIVRDTYKLPLDHPGGTGIGTIDQIIDLLESNPQLVPYKPDFHTPRNPRAALMSIGIYPPNKRKDSLFYPNSDAEGRELTSKNINNEIFSFCVVNITEFEKGNSLEHESKAELYDKDFYIKSILTEYGYSEVNNKK